MLEHLEMYLLQDKEEFWMTKVEYEEKGLDMLVKLGPSME